MKVCNGIVAMEGLVFRLSDLQYAQKVGETVLRLGFNARSVDITWASTCDGRMGVVNSMRERDAEYKKLMTYLAQEQSFKNRTIFFKNITYGLN